MKKKKVEIVVYDHEIVSIWTEWFSQELRGRGNNIQQRYKRASRVSIDCCKWSDVRTK